MLFGSRKRLATVETIKAVAKSSSKLRVIKRIRFIVLCFEIHDAFKGGEMEIAEAVYWRVVIVVQPAAAERPRKSLERRSAAMPPRCAERLCLSGWLDDASGSARVGRSPGEIEPLNGRPEAFRKSGGRAAVVARCSLLRSGLLQELQDQLPSSFTCLPALAGA